LRTNVRKAAFHFLIIFPTGKRPRVGVWTIDDPVEMQMLIDIGVDGIITDRPDLLMELLGR